MSRALVVAEHDNKKDLALSFGAALVAARKLADGVDALVFGNGCRAVAEAAARCAGVEKVLLCQHEALQNFLAENCAPVVVNAAREKKYSHIVAASGTFARNILPRAAALCDSQMISDIVEVKSADTFVRPIYAGNALATVKTSDSQIFLSARPPAFIPDDTPREGEPAAIEEGDYGAVDAGVSMFMEARMSDLARPELTAAKIVVSGGRGVGSRDNFSLIEKVADKLRAAVGASRAAVDAGYAPNDYQVGQTGKIIAPDLYIAVGISGAIQHIAGMKDSKIIVAINKDGDAPIFEIADYGLVGDLNEILPALEAALGE
jgi:electron transfer flavoprotein alpha subunit